MLAYLGLSLDERTCRRATMCGVSLKINKVAHVIGHMWELTLAPNVKMLVWTAPFPCSPVKACEFSAQHFIPLIGKGTESLEGRIQVPDKEGSSWPDTQIRSPYPTPFLLQPNCTQLGG